MADARITTAIILHRNEILASPGFARSKRLSAFLSWVVDRSLGGDYQSISERNIAILVYKRSNDFDPKLDGTVRAEAMRLRHKLREYYETGPSSAPRIEIPKGSYAPVFIGFEHTPELNSIPHRRVGAAPRRIQRRLAVAASVAILIAGGLLTTLRMRHANPARASVLIAEANRLRLIGDNVPALTLATQAVALDPHSFAAHLARAAVLQNLGQDRDALPEAALAQAIDSGARMAHPDQGVVARLRILDIDWSGAEGALRRLLAEEPESLDLLMQLATVQNVSESEAALATIRSARHLPGAEGNPELDRIEAIALGVLGAKGRPGKREAAMQVVLRGEKKAEALHATSAQARLVLLEGGLWMNLLDTERGFAALDRARQMCEAIHDDICVARTYRVNGNVNIAVGHHRLALQSYKKGLVLSRKWRSWLETERLLEGVDAAIGGLENVGGYHGPRFPVLPVSGRANWFDGRYEFRW